MSEKQAWAYIARKIEQEEPVGGLCREIWGLCYADRISWTIAADMRDTLRATFDCGRGFYWPRTREGHEKRVIAAQLLSEMAR